MWLSMKKIICSILFLILSNCSLDRDSQYWNEDSKKFEVDKKKLSKILKKTQDITEMTVEEYKFYIDDITKKSKYPDINK